jgi:hypothetical protein
LPLCLSGYHAVLGVKACARARRRVLASRCAGLDALRCGVRRNRREANEASRSITPLKEFHMILQSEQTLKFNAPAALSLTRHPLRTSRRYTLIPTADAVRCLEQEGFELMSARQTRARSSEGAITGRHMLCFRLPGDIGRSHEVDDLIPQVVLVNSHDGTSAYWLRAGIYRLACKNGLLVPMGDFGLIHVPHRGPVIELVTSGALAIARSFARVYEIIDRMKSWQLTAKERLGFADLALRERWPDVAPPVPAERLLEPRRIQDTDGSLWVTYNMIQEHVIAGGLRGRNVNGRAMSTRAVREIRRNVDLNTRLWHHALTLLPSQPLITG